MKNTVRTTSGNVDIEVSGRLVRIAKLNDEYYVPPPEPEDAVAQLRSVGARVDLYTFVQELHERVPRYPYHQEFDDVAVLPVSTYKFWMDKQIKFKCRNKIRKAIKSGVETRIVDFSDELLLGIKDVYDETPVRQGRRNWHYGKSLDTLRAEHSTFLDRSEFIGAYAGGELIGFAKVTHSPHYSIIMNIVAKVAHRGVAPANALIAKTIEATAARGIPLLKYGIWGRQSLNDFKESSAFECYQVPRYFLPLTPLGQMALKAGWHRGIKDLLPEIVVARAAVAREQWVNWRYGRPPKRQAHRDSAVDGTGGRLPDRDA